VSGREALLGTKGIATSDLSPNGQVRVKGEVWSAMAEDESIQQGDAVQITGIEGLRLKVIKENIDQIDKEGV
jgi:membrane-bound serine protease (ClpP class)